MRKVSLLIVMLMFAWVNMAYADNLEAEAVTLKPGGTTQMEIVLHNPTRGYMAFQLDLVLPEGISVAKDTNNQYMVSLNEDRITDHTLGVALMSKNTYRLLAYSINADEFLCTEGTLAYITLQADENTSLGLKTIQLKSKVTNDANGEQYKWENSSIMLTVVSEELLKDLQDKRESCEKFLNQIEETYHSITEGKEIEPSHKDYLDAAFSDMRQNVKSLLKSLDEKTLSANGYNETEISKIDTEYERMAHDVNPDNRDSPLYTFPYYMQSGTFSCNQGGCVKVGSCTVRNETRTIYYFYSKAFNTQYGKGGTFEIMVQPDEGYRVKTFNGEKYVETKWSSEDYFKSFDIEFTSIILGDVNGDEVVNASDIVEVVNYIMGNPSGKFDRQAADINGDGIVNAADIVRIVNTIMVAK